MLIEIDKRSNIYERVDLILINIASVIDAIIYIISFTFIVSYLRTYFIFDFETKIIIDKIKKYFKK
jgi:hypothetical protein